MLIQEKDPESTELNSVQADRAKMMFAAVVLAALDDAIDEDRKYGNGDKQIARWANSRDGHQVLMCAGIEPGERTTQGLMSFVAKGVRTSIALSREEQDRKEAALLDRL